jgi:hypothetical protein
MTNPRIMAVITGEIGLFSKPNNLVPNTSLNRILTQVKPATTPNPGKRVCTRLKGRPRSFVPQPDTTSVV